jgi:hypothetical protein
VQSESNLLVQKGKQSAPEATDIDGSIRFAGMEGIIAMFILHPSTSVKKISVVACYHLPRTQFL